MTFEMTMTATWRFTGWTVFDQYAISLSDAVTDIEGNHLDGEWTNPASITTTNLAVKTFPSGDGYAGGDFVFAMTLFGADVNLDNIGSAADNDLWKDAYTSDGLPWGPQFMDGDADGDGIIEVYDSYLIVSGTGLNLQNLWCLADLNGDLKVDALDEAIISNHLWMSNPTHADGDLNGNGQVWIDDLDLLFAQYGLDLDVVS